MAKIGDRVSVTSTAEGLSKRDIAVAVIADKLGIPESEVNEHTDLGRHAHDITMTLTVKGLGDMFIANFGMKAEDVFSQL